MLHLKWLVIPNKLADPKSSQAAVLYVGKKGLTHKKARPKGLAS